MSELAENYKKNYSKSHKLTIHEYDIPFQAINKYIKRFPADSFILDAGCGNGRYAKQLLRKRYSNIYAVDIFLNEFENISFAKASIDDLPHENNKFDFIYCLSVIHYLENIEKGINELERILKPNGILLFTAFNRFSIYAIIRRIKKKLKLDNKYSLNKLTFLSSSQYKKILRNNGFEIIEINGYLLPQYTQLLNYLEFRGCNTRLAPKINLSNNKLISGLKADFGYHTIFIVKKK